MVNLGLIEYNITEVIKSKLGDSTYYLIFSSHTKPSSKADRAKKKGSHKKFVVCICRSWIGAEYEKRV